MTVALAIAAGGLGAVARYGISGFVQRAIRSTRPWGTAAVNLAGALALGVLIGLRDSAVVSTGTLTVVGTGFFGGFTTFSTWMVESVNLVEVGGASGRRAGTVNVVGQLAVGVMAAWLGAVVGSKA